MTFRYWLNDYYKNRQQRYNDLGNLEGERVGEAFVNDFVSTQWQELYYEENHQKALAMIVDFLVSCHYYPDMPQKGKHHEAV